MTDRPPRPADAFSWVLSRLRARSGPPPVKAGPAPLAPPPLPPTLNRTAGALLLIATLGLASCQAFIAAVS